MSEFGADLIGVDRLDEIALDLLDARVAPIFVPRLPSGRPEALADKLESAVARLVGHLLSPEQVTNAASAIPRAYHLFFDSERAKKGDSVERRELALRWLTHLLSRRLASPKFTPLGEHRQSRVWSRFPRLRPWATEEGLVRLSEGLRFDTSGIQIDGFSVPLHPWLDHHRGGNPESDFLAWLCDYARTSGSTVAIAVDWRCWTPVEQVRELVYYDHWYGRPFARKDLDDPHAVGLTVHSNPIPRTLADGAEVTERAEFLWTAKEGIKTVQVEEVAHFGRAHPRYVHAEYVMGKGFFRHMDGAAMVYDPESLRLRTRVDCHLGRSPRATQKPKLFRIDGAVSVDDWALGTALFFRSNTLVHEYLGGDTEPPSEPAGA